MKNSFAVYKYNTQADLKDLSEDDILFLDTNDVNYTIETQTGGVPLPYNKMQALLSLLNQKKKLDIKKASQISSGSYLTKTKTDFSIAPASGNHEINVFVDKNLAYVPGNSIIITNLESPLETMFEATVVSYNLKSGNLVFSGISHLKGNWSANTPAVVNLDGIDGKQGIQ